MKKVISVVLAGAMLATSVSVVAPALAEEAAAPAASVQKSSVNAVYNQYLDVLQRYKKAQDNNLSPDAIRDLDINGNIVFSSDGPPLSYALVDLAQDGSPELVIARVGEKYNDILNKGGYMIYDIRGSANGTAKRLFDTYSMGYRHIFTLRENGVVTEVIIGGSSYIYTQFHKLNANSASPQALHFVLQTGWVGQVPSYYRGTMDLNSYYSIGEAEYNSLRNQYEYLQNITWHPIDDYASLWSELNANTIPVFVDGVQISFDQQPIIRDDRTLVPLRGVFEALGATVYWNNDTRSVTAYKDDTTVELAIGSSTMYVNGQPKYLDVAGQIINDRTLVPLRAISEAFEAIVYWDNDTRTVRVYSDESTIPSDPDEPDVEDPDVDTPNNPDVSDSDVDTPSNPDVNYPVIKEPDNPKEEQPSVDEQTKNVAYNAALLQLQNGYSYDAYYGFKALGNFKNSESLLEQALWLNRISVNITYWGYTGARNYDWYKSYSRMSDDEIYNALINKTFYVPSAQSPQFGATLFKENGISYYLGDNTALNSRYDQGNWFIAKHGVFLNKGTMNDPTIYDQTFIKLTEGLYANIIYDQFREYGSRPYDGFFFDSSSLIGQGLKAYFERYVNSNYTNRDKVIEEDLGLF